MPLRRGCVASAFAERMGVAVGAPFVLAEVPSLCYWPNAMTEMKVNHGSISKSDCTELIEP